MNWMAATLVFNGLLGWADEPKPDGKPIDPAKEITAETRHSVEIGRQKITYEAVAGLQAIKEDDGKTKALIFHVAYTKSGVTDLSSRPITFCFNGGPGSSSVWLHLGAFGPRRVLMEKEGKAPPPPYRVIPNDASLLDISDLVFIDPVSTGYSRAMPGVDAKQFHSVDSDIQAVGEFIRLYLTRKQRWGSPKFLAGESYGTTRAAGLAHHLNDQGIYFNGLLLISAVLNFQTIRFDTGNDLPYVLFLPSYTATAYYHRRLGVDLQAELRKTLQDVEAFAISEYLPALSKGEKLPPDEKMRVSQKLARFTGLSREFIDRSNLRIDQGRFSKELLRDRRRTVGRFDSRYEGIDGDAAGANPEYDPSHAAVGGAFPSALNQYLRGDLNFVTDLKYEILTSKVQPWNFSANNRYLDVSESLRRAMTENKSLRVFVASGYFDLATPYFATDYTINHVRLDPEIADHVSMAYYEAGHMMYVRESMLAKLKQDMANFYQSALPKQ